MANATTEHTPAQNPWIRRENASAPPESASAHERPATVKPANPDSKAGRRPCPSDKVPPPSWPTAKPTMKSDKVRPATARDVPKASGSNGRVGALTSIDRAGSAANRPRTTVKPRDFGAICNAFRACRCWLTPMRELRSNMRLGEAANGDRVTCVNGSGRPEPTGCAFFLIGCRIVLPMAACQSQFAIGEPEFPRESTGSAIQLRRTTLGCNENDIDLMFQRRS